jgi:hypothetical protein
MLAETYRNGGPKKKAAKSLTDIIEETLKKPSISVENLNEDLSKRNL